MMPFPAQETPIQGGQLASGMLSQQAEQTPGVSQSPPGSKVYVGKLSYKTQWMALKDLFAQAGTVTYAKVLREDGPYGRGSWSRGSGFVEFSSPQEAANAVQMFNGTELDGRQIVVDLWDEAAPKQTWKGGQGWTSWSGGKGGGKGKNSDGVNAHNEDPACKVYIGNLSYKTKWSTLKEFMSSAGTVSYAKVLEDKGAGKGFWSRGVGFVIYSTPAEATAAVSSMNGQELDGRQIKVDHWSTGSSAAPAAAAPAAAPPAAS
eukprot:CAMPEP_0178430596 /NCGR_PEP_ID=MMETSP0689_2-20121128/31405_1 /TAXON_ID=160604 /ORGANISM="Amphidinium massartii, Strain CS-259" /LENGTH=260 /DNA_ID=CAMNT_0020052465 /DNA_START=65 /DNA_END=847 /DNA_ORIENTATION=+